jgi:hypothetical protein
VLQPDAIAKTCVVYDTLSGAAAGVRVENAGNGSRLVFFGFGFEAINAAPGFARRENVMRNVLNWLEGTTAVDAPAGSSENLPAQFYLSASFPNPFSVSARAPETVIHYQVPASRSAARVTLKIYDVMGREVTTLVNEETQPPGFYRMAWNGRDQKGHLVRNGIYFYQLQSGNFHAVRKMVVVR